MVHVVRGDDREPELGGECRGLRHEPVVVGQEVVRELEEETALRRPVTSPEDRRIPLSYRPRPCPVTHPQSPGDLALTTAGQRDNALGVLGEKCLGEPRYALGSGQIRPGDEAAQAPVAGSVSRQQDEMRPPLPLPDPAPVLLDDGPVTREPGSIRTRPGRQALD